MIKILNFYEVFLFIKDVINLNIVIESQKNELNLVAYYFELTFCNTAYGEIQPPKEV